MSEEEQSDIENTGEAKDADKVAGDRVEFRLGYRDTSSVDSTADRTELTLYGNLYSRRPVRLHGRVTDPLLLREALASLYDVIKSDQRYIPKDRSAYLAYQTMRKKSASLQAWEARQEYFDWLERNDPNAWLVLDPVISVFPDVVYWEAFSKDEAVYASLSIDRELIRPEGDVRCGTTNIDFTDELFQGVERMRGHRDTTLRVESEGLAVETVTPDGDAPRGSTVIEKKVRVPASWLRGFLQIQSAAMLDRVSFSLAPIDLYNLLRHLRLNADRKREGRAIRIELVPGEYPRLVLEPWELVLETTAGIYRGPRTLNVKLWGRRRLQLFTRLLPFATEIDVHVLGSGLPAFFVLRAGAVTLTLSLSGFTSENWSRAAAFDLLLPRSSEFTTETKTVLDYLQQNHSATAENIALDLRAEKRAVLEALQIGCQHGKLIFDLEKTYFGFARLRISPWIRPGLNFGTNANGPPMT